MRKKNLFLLFLFLIVSITINSQTKISVSGTVTDDNGTTLIGVSVTVAGTTMGTMTDINGSYSIEVPSSSSLTFSYLGFVSQTHQVGSQSVINVIMKEDNQALEEVVVVGYGVQKRRDVTGSVVSIKPSDLENMPNSNIVQSLQGKLPGLNIVNTGTSAEGSTTMRVRAQNSINADSGPLVILDGIQYDGFLSEISPNDIESIEVLKDASSAAIYGAKAANGVLLVTTKKGIAGKTRVSFESSVSISNVINRPDMMDATQFYNFKKARLGISSLEEEQYLKGVNTDWLDLATQTGIGQNYNLIVSGGNDATRFLVSGNVSQIKGVAKNDQFNRYTFRLNMDTDILSWLKFGTNTSFSYNSRPGEGANISNANRMNPLLEAYDVDGNLIFQPNQDDLSVSNPLEGLNVKKEDVARGIVTTNFLQVDFPFLKGLSYKLLGGYNYRTRLIEQYKASYNTLEGQQKGGSATVNNQYKEDWSIENILSYNYTFGLHTFDATAVYSAREYVTKYHDNTGVGFPGDYMTYYQFKLATTLSPSDTYIKESSLSQMFRLNYNYDSKYLFTFTVRRDGFSAFGSNNKYGTFPSIALGWNIDRESFMQQVKWFDRAKLRLSYGENGNQAIGAYTTMPTMSNQYYLDNNGNPLIGFYPNKLADPTLSWETTRQVNVGLDFSFLNGRIFGSFDTYFANTFDLLLNKQIPQINGVSSIRQNIGKTKSNGIEFQVSTVNLKSKDFTWRTDFNITHSKNEIVNVGLFDENGNALDNVGSRWFIGEPIKVIYSYEFDGIWQETDDILNSHMPMARPGDVRIKDYNKDGEITTDDRHIIGYQDPDYTIGLMNTFSYKNLTFSFFFNASHGVTRFTEYMNTYFDGKTNIRQREWWTPENKLPSYPANRDDSNPYGLNYFGKTNDASYIRLSDISLGYKIPASLTKKLGVSRLEVYSNVKNVFTLTDYIGLDPEFTSDYGVPQTRTFLFGLRLGI